MATRKSRRKPRRDHKALKGSRSAAALMGAVDFKYRGAKGKDGPHGTAIGTTTGGTKGDPMEVIRPSPDSRHPGEPATIHRRRSNLRAR